MTDEAQVTQADRDAAAYIADLCQLGFSAHYIRQGKHDDRPVVQAFARHRLAAEQATIERCAKVAEEMPPEMLFMWDRPGGPPGNGYGPTRPVHVAAAIRALATPVAAPTSPSSAKGR